MTRPLRLALISAFPPGTQSLNEYGLHLATGLAARDDVAEVVVIADKLPVVTPENDYDKKIRVERVWDFNALSTLPKLLRAIKKENVDGVIWNLQTATFGDREATAALGLLAPAATRFMGVTSGVIAHNIVEGIDLDQTVLQGQLLRQKIVRFGASMVTRAMASASYMTVTLRGYHETLTGKYPSADLHLVPHGTFDTSTGDLSPLSERPRRIVTMGKFGTYKRLETLLAAFDKLREDAGNEDLELIIGGSDHPNTPGYLETLRDQRKNDAGVTFAGYVAEEDVPSFFGEARLSVFDYSATTGSSGVLHQTASYGAVPVFPRIGDFIDVCEDEGISGVNYAPQDADDMATQIQRALDDEESAQQIADSNQVASQGFPFAKVVEFHVDKIREAAKPAADSTPISKAKTAI